MKNEIDNFGRKMGFKGPFLHLTKNKNIFFSLFTPFVFLNCLLGFSWVVLILHPLPSFSCNHFKVRIQLSKKPRNKMPYYRIFLWTPELFLFQRGQLSASSTLPCFIHLHRTWNLKSVILLFIPFY